MAAFTGDDLDLELGEVASVDVTSVGGEVAVTSGTGPVRVRVRVLRGDPAEVTVERGTLRITHELPQALLARLVQGQGPEALIEVVAPRAADVRVRTVSAGVVVAGFEGPPSIIGVSGTITASEVGGLVATTVSGAIEGQAIHGPLSVSSVSGEVTVDGGRFDHASVKTVSGDVLLDVDALGETTMTSVSGAIAIRLPEDAAACLDAVTVNGHLDCAFPLADTVSTKRRLTGAIGGGGPAVRARTVSGDLSLLRRRLVPA